MGRPGPVLPHDAPQSHGTNFAQMPRKIRQLLADLRSAGFQLDRQKGSHRQFKHPNSPNVITLAGAEGDDSKRYQERQVADSIAKTKSLD